MFTGGGRGQRSMSLSAKSVITGLMLSVHTQWADRIGLFNKGTDRIQISYQGGSMIPPYPLP